MQRRRTAATAGLALALGLVLGACGQSNTPESYDSLVEKNYLEGCTNRSFDLTDDTLAITDDTLSADVEGGTEEQCRCQYQVFVDMVPYDGDDTSKPDYQGPTFTELDDSLRDADDPAAVFGELPSDVRAALDSCPLPGGSEGDDTEEGSQSTTTTVADGTSTTTSG